MENLEIEKLFGGSYAGKRIVVTGHTGFKGSWLSLWLKILGADVTGISLASSSRPNHWRSLNLDINSIVCDIRDYTALGHAINKARPHFVFHLAAQALVRQSYQYPRQTWETNVIGTANLLEACRNSPHVKGVIVASSDKCYENINTKVGYKENDRLGGHDPYSASKAATELVASSYVNTFSHETNCPLIATARAGNVIGGGDWSTDRLIPDLVLSLDSKKKLKIRSPNATRPWQHVLDCLSGYLRLGQFLMDSGLNYQGAWNFGPRSQDQESVSGLIGLFRRQFPNLAWHHDTAINPHEAHRLHLDTSKSETNLGWKPTWKLETAAAKTAEWYQHWLESETPISQQQIFEYVSDAKTLNANWT